MRSITLLFSILLSFSIFGQYTAVSKPESIKAFIKEKQANLKTIESKFEETTVNPMLKEPQKGKGYFYFSKPNKIRWENNTSQVTMLMDGKSTHLFEKGKIVNGVAANKITASIQSMIVSMISGDFLDNGDYNVHYFQSNTLYKLELTPKNSRMAKEIKQMVLYFNRSNGLLSSMEMIQKTGATVTYQFTEMKINKEIINSKYTQL